MTTVMFPDVMSRLDNQTSIGLAGTVDSLGYRVAEIETHLHNKNQTFGQVTNNMIKDSVVAFSLTGGNSAWGTEIQVHDGTVIETGSSTKKFDLYGLNIATVGTANVTTQIQALYGSIDGGQLGSFVTTSNTYSKLGAATAATVQGTPDTLTSAGNCPANDTRVMLSTIVTSTGITNAIIYYVVASTVATTNTTFQLSLTSGGAAVAITNDGTCNFHIVTACGLANDTKIMVSGSVPAALNAYTTHYVVSGGVASLTFQLSLTSGGAAIVIATTGQLTYYVVTQTELTNWLMTSAVNTPSNLVLSTPCPRITCNNRVWLRAKSNGATNALGLLFNIHTYSA